MIVLKKDRVRCLVTPAVGGSIAALAVDGVDLLRPAPVDNEDVLKSGCFPLVPFANRVADARFTFDGERIEIEPDREAPPHALHGHGWRAAWQVETAAEDRAVLRLDHKGGGWPWDYSARQILSLLPGGLNVVLEVTNRSARPMPLGLGLHPYFPAGATTRIAAAARSIWLNDARGVADVVQEANPFAGDGADVPIGALLGLDNFFDGPVNGILISSDASRIAVTSGEARGFHLYAPPGEDYVCLEPVTHVPNSFNDERQPGHQIVDPGATATIGMSIVRL
ncbi:aldose 1-epimerase [Sphingomonas oleivorans]|nr:aldose 1-epimerase [Sphingomonas oleivorans]